MLIVIIAIGESLVAIGLGARGAALDTGVIVAAVLALVVVASFWLAYFDFFPIRGQQMLVDRSGTQRTTLARDVYTYEGAGSGWSTFLDRIDERLAQS